MNKKLFIPGPTYVRPEVLAAQAQTMIGHRMPEYSLLQAEITDKLKKLLYSDQRVYIYTSASTGVMEGVIRQASTQRILVTVCGAFSQRWYEIVEANGIACDKLEVPEGQAITSELVEEALSKDSYDAITLTMNETATGIMNPVQAISEMIHEKFPGTLILVDAVSCMSGVKIEFDKWGLDVCLAGTQKCFALPPGLTVCAVSDRARERALQVKNRGYYFSYSAMDKHYEKFQTPATPAISLMFALNKQLDDMFQEGLENRFLRHSMMADHVQEWARTRFRLYGNELYLSKTVTNIENTREIDIKKLNEELGKRGAVISNGYGKLKDKCFRIGHMGDLTMEDVTWLTNQIDDILELA
jgi:aspartate aminotransferase-like enzyme